jgi:hypothetical protein
MFAEIDGNEKSLFERMLVSNYFQKDEVSVEISLKDSTFAKAGQINLKIPQGFGASKQLETSYGEECLLKPYRIDKPEELLSQGMTDVSALQLPQTTSPELEQTIVSSPGKILTTWKGKPSFAKNFVTFHNGNTSDGQGVIYIKQDRFPYYLGPQFYGTEGRFIEIAAGEGKGNCYKIVEVEFYKDFQWLSQANPPFDCFMLTLDRPIGDIRNEYPPGSSPLYVSLPNLNSSDSYAYSGVDASVMRDNWDGNISAFKFVENKFIYAIPLARNIIPMPSSQNPLNAIATNDDGSLSDIGIEFKEIKKTKDYSIVEFLSLQDDKIDVVKIGKHQPRWRIESDRTAFWINDSGQLVKPDSANGKFNIFPREGEQVAADSEDSEAWQIVAKHSSEYLRGLNLIVSLYWRIDDLSFDGEYEIVPRFSYMVDNGHGAIMQAFLIDDAGNAIYRNSFYPTALSFGRDSGISLTRDKIVGHETSNLKKFFKEIKRKLTFNSNAKAKYIYLRFSYNLSQPYSSSSSATLRFSALPAKCTRKVDLEKIHLKGSFNKLNSEIFNITNL